MSSFSKFRDWLDENVPGVGGCLLAMDDTNPERLKYFLIERYLDGSGNPVFIVNGHVSYDIEYAFNDHWKVIYQKLV